MAIFNWQSRGRRGRGRLPRNLRLALLAGVLLLIVLGVVLLVRGCSKDDPAVPVSDATQRPTLAPSPDADAGAGETSAPAEEPDDERPSLDDGDVEDDALKNVGDEQVDLDADLKGSEPVPTASAGNRAVTIRSIGDIVGHIPILRSAYDETGKTYDFSPIFSQISGSMAAADYTVINVDGPMPGRKYANGYRGYPQFNTPPFLLNALKDAGVNMLTLANNHALDTYFDGLKATIDNVEKVGLDHIGAYRSQEEYDAPYIREIGGIKVGFLNYATATNGMAKKSDPEASLYGLRMTSNSNAPKDIQALRDAGAEAVIVYMHWGEEYNRNVTNSIKNLAKKLVAAGADVVVGGHQHVVLPCEWLTAKGEDGAERRGLVLYGMGNFLSDQRTRYRDSGLIFQFTLQDNPATGKVEVTAPRYVPVYVHRTANGSGYEYRVLACGEVIENPPAGMGTNVLNRIKQVWNEQKEVMAGGPAEALKR